jgi:hypothetical protein
MKTRVWLFIFCWITVAPLNAQDAVIQAAARTCDCMKEINPDDYKDKDDLTLKIFGCLGTGEGVYIDAAERALIKAKTVKKDERLKVLDIVGREVRKQCPEQFERLKKKEIKTDPAALKIAEADPLSIGFADAVCRCVGAGKSTDDCIDEVMDANKDYIQKQLGDNMFKAMMGLMSDVLFDLADRCEAASTDEAIAKLQAYPKATGNCKDIIIGTYETETILGKNTIKITANRYTEYNAEGKVAEDFTLEWNDCNAVLTVVSASSEMIKKGQQLNMQIRRASAEGFVSIIDYGGLKAGGVFKKTN